MKNQSIIICGESGAGKTVSTKLILQYISIVGGKAGVGDMEKQILCENFDIDMETNMAIAYNNVLIKSEDRYMKAEMISFNIVSKEININSDNKVTIETN